MPHDWNQTGDNINSNNNNNNNKPWRLTAAEVWIMVNVHQGAEEHQQTP